MKDVKTVRILWSKVFQTKMDVLSSYVAEVVVGCIYGLFELPNTILVFSNTQNIL